MAEVILLVVFVLLMALAAAWRAEHEQKAQVEKKLKDITASLSLDDPNNLVALEEVGSLLRSPERARILANLKHISAGQCTAILNESEARPVSEIVTEVRKGDPSKIDKHWRELVAAAKAIARVAPEEVDEKKVAEWIELGQRMQREGEHDWPPVINLHEAEGYTFATGRADLTPIFEQKLKTIMIPKLVELIDQYKVDVIEVIGHTDEQPIAQRASNLDQMLLDTLKPTGSITSLVPADNAGLGLSRAVSVARALMLDSTLRQYRILPYSGGQLIEINERITSGGGGNVANRRRIEIRLRRSQESLGRGP
jgi:outer membrane protein OmpA-like peptidoglycan-associated protein